MGVGLGLGLGLRFVGCLDLESSASLRLSLLLTTYYLLLTTYYLLGEQREPPPLLLLQCLQVVKVPLPEEACPRR